MQAGFAGKLRRTVSCLCLTQIRNISSTWWAGHSVVTDSKVDRVSGCERAYFISFMDFQSSEFRKCIPPSLKNVSPFLFSCPLNIWLGQYRSKVCHKIVLTFLSWRGRCLCTSQKDWYPLFATDFSVRFKYVTLWMDLLFSWTILILSELLQFNWAHNV